MPEVSQRLRTAAGLRCPVFASQDGARTKIERLESYLLLTAFTQGELAEERLDLMAELEVVARQWEHLDGYQELVRTRTEAAVTDAKRRLAPELYERKRELEWRVKRLSEELERLERDATKASRCYTMITGT